MSRDRLENSVNGLALPAEAAQDQRVFPGGTGKFARRPVATIDCLQPFLHLLPDLSDVDAKEQKRLYQTIYSAGVSAALTLHKYLYESADGGKGASPATVADRLSRVELNALDLKEVSHSLLGSSAIIKAYSRRFAALASASPLTKPLTPSAS